MSMWNSASWALKVRPRSRAHLLLCLLGLHAWGLQYQTWPGPPEGGRMWAECVVCCRRKR